MIVCRLLVHCVNFCWIRVDVLICKPNADCLTFFSTCEIGVWAVVTEGQWVINRTQKYPSSRKWHSNLLDDDCFSQPVPLVRAISDRLRSTTVDLLPSRNYAVALIQVIVLE
jgi:hypothetical protein